MIASVFLFTLTVYGQHEPLPDELIARLRDAQEEMLELWGTLNRDE